MSVLLSVRGLKKYFVQGGGILGGEKEVVKAVDGVSFDVKRGETLALVGESGCGKTTTGRLVLRLLEPDDGEIIFDGVNITHMSMKELRPFRRRMQMIYQDPYASLNPRKPIGEAIAEPLIVHGLAEKEEAKEQAMKMLERVGLTPAEDFYDRIPSQLSGGQRQRVVIARAMILKPEFVVADEPVSMIDVSMRASILELLKGFQEEYGLAMIFITHDLSVARLVADKIAVMYLGKIIEYGPVDKVLRDPRHPYTAALATAAPSITMRRRKRLDIKGEIADPRNLPSGCRFHPRCPYAKEDCASNEPRLREMDDGRLTACHYPLEEGFLDRWLKG
ncbi:MAG: ABC transporter ATP-binding protein [Desulfurococcales archaeon]|nr:ABC transporter ATP-binding protein [Desulfurococcales archaeon]MCE4626981.1 ABC transporter ATP-binding protein [Desulfurococcales archaeon]MCE4629442.1 ABC transporter ATP-binding protein [Desulfurococcales archaeon]